MIHMDLESNVQVGENRRPHLLIRVWKVPVPLRKGYVVPDLIKSIACLMAVM
jgi:hypothetical protein